MDQELNRLYWLGRNGLWKHVFSCTEEVNLNVEVRRKMGASLPRGVRGYSMIRAKYSDGYKTLWYEHVVCAGSFTRSLVDECHVPKPVLLLEMMQ